MFCSFSHVSLTRRHTQTGFNHQIAGRLLLPPSPSLPHSSPYIWLRQAWAADAPTLANTMCDRLWIDSISLCRLYENNTRFFSHLLWPLAPREGSVINFYTRETKNYRAYERQIKKRVLLRDILGNTLICCLACFVFAVLSVRIDDKINTVMSVRLLNMKLEPCRVGFHFGSGSKLVKYPHSGSLVANESFSHDHPWAYFAS